VVSWASAGSQVQQIASRLASMSPPVSPCSPLDQRLTPRSIGGPSRSIAAFASRSVGRGSSSFRPVDVHDSPPGSRGIESSHLAALQRAHSHGHRCPNARGGDPADRGAFPRLHLRAHPAGRIGGESTGADWDCTREYADGAEANPTLMLSSTWIRTCRPSDWR
jgi:hypothetical protein